MESEPRQEDVVRLLVKSQSMLSAFLYAQCEDWELVEDAGQETSVYVCSHWRDYRPGSSFGSWIRTIAHLRLKELIRQKSRSRKAGALDGIAAEIPDAVWNDEGAFGVQHKAALAACLASLSPQMQEVVRLRFQDGRDGAFLARYLNKNLESVYMLLSRLRRQLKGCVEQRVAKGGA